jgi:hypothetical protein
VSKAIVKRSLRGAGGAIEAAINKGLRDVLATDRRRAGEVGDRARDACVMEVVGLCSYVARRRPAK